MRVLVTGGHGFVGRHLGEHLLKCGDDVALTYLPNARNEEADNKYPIPKAVQSLALDITNKKAVDDLLALLRPDAVYHLAGLSFVPAQENDMNKVFAVNTFGTTNILDAVSKHAKKAKVLIVTSAEVYGEPRPGSLPLTEAAELRPVSLYGASKAAADLMTFTYAFRDGVDAIRVRPFNHTGPGQSDHFSIAGFAKQVAAIKLGKASPKILVGNLDAKSDFSDVSDIVRGYREALLNGKRGEAYNLCSGRSVEVKEMLNRLIAIAEIEAEITVDESRLRPVDIVDIYGSYQRAQKDFGWKPRIELDGTLSSLLAYWVEVLSKR